MRNEYAHTPRYNNAKQFKRWFFFQRKSLQLENADNSYSCLLKTLRYTSRMLPVDMES